MRYGDDDLLDCLDPGCEHSVDESNVHFHRSHPMETSHCYYVDGKYEAMLTRMLRPAPRKPMPRRKWEKKKRLRQKARRKKKRLMLRPTPKKTRIPKKKTMIMKTLKALETWKNLRVYHRPHPLVWFRRE